jgi:hypothetical protein
VSGMTDLERLVALEEIFRLKGRRDRALDTKDWEGYIALHVPEHVSENEGEEPRRGARENAEGVARILEGILTVHHGHTPDITFESATTARGVWGMEDLLFDAQTRRLLLHGFGFYHERYEKRDGQWLFCWRQLRRTVVHDFR